MYKRGWIVWPTGSNVHSRDIQMLCRLVHRQMWLKSFVVCLSASSQMPVSTLKWIMTRIITQCTPYLLNTSDLSHVSIDDTASLNNIRFIQRCRINPVKRKQYILFTSYSPTNGSSERFPDKHTKLNTASDMHGSITSWFSSAANKNSTRQTFLHTTNRASQSRCNCFALA